MNENNMSEPADGDHISRLRREVDITLTTEAVREGYVRGYRTAVGNLMAVVCLTTVAGMLTLQSVSQAAGAYIILYGPMTVGLGFMFRGSFLARRALKWRQALPMWERHHIALTLIEVSKKDGAK